ncbi:hypothetical protein AXF42_Ash010758 [Apostasia shenzhenica]|uniref:Ribonuclease H1 N-terminal domain-containing protein n=1 Tax=Apostasia shenzhenica TaxID=1088818 RepID=A0A2I0A0M8_9ASPA|nr:hypothetical protein AXF42_Ash010758 [Apostasia shenzhenica]
MVEKEQRVSGPIYLGEDSFSGKLLATLRNPSLSFVLLESILSKIAIYVVLEGHRRGVYYRWENCFAQVNRFSRALYFKVALRAEGECHLQQHISRILQTSSRAFTLSMTNLTVDQLHATSSDDNNINVVTASLLVGLLVGLALGPSRRIE